MAVFSSDRIHSSPLLVNWFSTNALNASGWYLLGLLISEPFSTFCNFSNSPFQYYFYSSLQIPTVSCASVLLPPNHAYFILPFHLFSMLSQLISSCFALLFSFFFITLFGSCFIQQATSIVCCNSSCESGYFEMKKHENSRWEPNEPAVRVFPLEVSLCRHNLRSLCLALHLPIAPVHCVQSVTQIPLQAQANSPNSSCCYCCYLINSSTCALLSLHLSI